MATTGSPGSSGHKDEPPSRKRRENKSTVVWDTFHHVDVLAKLGWKQEVELWTRITCQKYIDWAHINRHWDFMQYETHVKSGVVNINKCQNPTFKKRLIKVTLALWKEVTKKDEMLSQCQMAYAKVFLAKDVDWTTFVAKKQKGRFPAKLCHIPPNPLVLLDSMAEDMEVVHSMVPEIPENIGGGNVVDVHQLQGLDLAIDVQPLEQHALQGTNATNEIVVLVAVHDQLNVNVPPQQQNVFLNTIGGVDAIAKELQSLRELVLTLQAEKAEASRKHAVELDAQRAKVEDLVHENVKLVASHANFVSRGRQLSTNNIQSLDDVVASATYDADESLAGPINTSAFVVRHCTLLPPPNFQGKSSSAAQTEAIYGMLNLGGPMFDAMRARAEHAEVEATNTKASMEQLTNSIHALELRSKAAEDNVVVLTSKNTELQRRLEELKALNTKLVQSPERKEMLAFMCNMKLACSIALNKVKQMQREVKRVAAEFNDGGQRYFGLTSWPGLEKMFPDTLPVNNNNASIDWNLEPALEFQYNSARYRYADGGQRGIQPLLWPSVPQFVKDGTKCIIYQEPFGPEGGWSLGTCPHLYHPMCLIPHMVTRKRCAFCRAPFHSRLYKMFSLAAHMPSYYKYNKENLPGADKKDDWGKDMTWFWKWFHDSKHLSAETLHPNNNRSMHWKNDAHVTNAIKGVIRASEPGRRLFVTQLAGGHWDVERDIFVCAPHPNNLLFDSNGDPMGIAGELSFEEEIAYIKDNTFHEATIVNTVFNHLHIQYDVETAAILRTLQSSDELQRFLRIE